MDLTYLSIISFIIITMVYYAIPSIGKISVTLKALSSVEEMELFKRESNTRLAIYLAVVILSQFIINTSFVINACGGSSVSNYGTAFLITFLPWIFIFGIMLITLIMYPGFKGAFADIVGYFFVSEKANDALSTILMSDAVTQTAINGITDINVKSDLIKAAESVSKMLGNKAIIINQITPLNFIDMWNTLKQLMKPTMFENEEIKANLLDISVMRDNIGESMWYIYTGILIISYTSFKITSSACPPEINNLVKRNAKKVNETIVKKVINPTANATTNAANTTANATTNAANITANASTNAANATANATTNAVNATANATTNATSNATTGIVSNAVQPMTSAIKSAATTAQPIASSATQSTVAPQSSAPKSKPSGFKRFK